MNEIAPPIRWGKTKEGLYWLIDATGEMIALGQINALLAERDELVDEIKSLRLIVVDGDAKIKSLMAIAMVAVLVSNFCDKRGLISAEGVRNTLQPVISAHEQKYGPIGGE